MPKPPKIPESVLVVIHTPEMDVLVIERASFQTPWSRGAFRYALTQTRVARCLVARRGRRLLGYLCLWEMVTRSTSRTWPRTRTCAAAGWPARSWARSWATRGPAR